MNIRKGLKNIARSQNNESCRDLIAIFTVLLSFTLAPLAQAPIQSANMKPPMTLHTEEICAAATAFSGV